MFGRAQAIPQSLSCKPELVLYVRFGHPDPRAFGIYREGIQRHDTLAECLKEADGALRVLKKLVQQDDLVCARFAVSAVSNVRFAEIAQYNTIAEREESLKRGLEFITAAKATLA